MAKKNTGGLPSIFRNKKGGARYQGVLTKPGSMKFEEARKRLAKLAARRVRKVSDADVMEFLARGESETVIYLTQNMPAQ